MRLVRWIATSTVLAAAGILVALETPIVEVAPPIRLNTLGYFPDAPKRATVAVPCERFAVVRVADGTRVFEGVAAGPVHNADTDEQLYTADFSAVVEPGDYQLDVPDVGESSPFRIAADLYDQPFCAVMKAMYLMRCGTAVHSEDRGQSFKHAACHLDDGYLDLVEPSPGASVQGRGVRKDAVGGWHDAGDFNKYVVNGSFSVGCLLRAWADFRPRLAPIDVDIPESGGPLPDFLAELKWELDWLLTMQAADGSVYHKLSAENYSGYMMPDADSDRRYFGEWGSGATADFVAATAMASRSFRPYDAAYSDRCLAAAKRGYQFLQQHPDYRRPGQKGFTTVGYDSTDWDDRLWALAELWEATGDADALSDFETRAASAQPAHTEYWQNYSDLDENGRTVYQCEFSANWDWGNTKGLALITYLFSERIGRNETLLARIRGNLIATADGIVEMRNAHGYGRPLGDRYYWGCNGTVARQLIVLEAANRVAANRTYRETGLDALNHLFGRNVFGRSFVTGLGVRPPLHPHDRRFAADGVDVPWPGYLVGGPLGNARDWRDEQDDYRTNEIAINWNAALIYALAGFLENPAGEPAGK